MEATKNYPVSIFDDCEEHPEKSRMSKMQRRGDFT